MKERADVSMRAKLVFRTKKAFDGIKAHAYEKNYDFIFCLFWYAQQQNPYNL
jgi:hypothetical protein